MQTFIIVWLLSGLVLAAGIVLNAAPLGSWQTRTEVLVEYYGWARRHTGLLVAVIVSGPVGWAIFVLLVICGCILTMLGNAGVFNG
jgi:hypothetical protein